MFRHFTEDGKNFNDKKMRYCVEFFFAGDHALKSYGHTRRQAIANMKAHLKVIQRKSGEGLASIENWEKAIEERKQANSEALAEDLNRLARVASLEVPTSIDLTINGEKVSGEDLRL